MTPDPFREQRELEYPELPRTGGFFNAASYGLMPRRAVEASAAITRSRNRVDGVEEKELGPHLHRAREAAARLVGARPEEIALTPNTTFGVNLAAACVAAGPPGVVLMSRGEFPANLVPWLALEERGFPVERLPVDADGWPREDALAERLRSGDVRALALSFVQFHTGYLADLPRLGSLCREVGALFCVDGIQGLGAAPLDVEEARVDVLASGAQKWLCAPWGSGFTYVREGLQDRFEPPMPSWLAYRGSRDFGNVLGDPGGLLPDARRFEPATLGVQDYAAMARSLELFLELGVEGIRAHVQALHEPLLDLCRRDERVSSGTPEDPDRRAGILALRVPDPGAVGRALAEAGFVLSVREGLVRFAPHWYNTREEVEEAAGVVVEVLEGG